MHKRSTYTTEELVSALIHAYSAVMDKRREQGNTWTGLTRKEYQDNKRDEDPHYWDIERILGSWSDFTRLIPSNERSQIIPRDVNVVKSFREAILSVSEENNKPPHEVSYRDFIRYQDRHPEKEIHDWRTYAKILGTSTWINTRHKVLYG